MMRRFVNLVTLDCAERVYSVRRMDPYKQLFYESAKAATEAADEAATSFPALQLPPPVMNFMGTDRGGTMDFFALFSPRGTSEGRIVYANRVGEAGLYDADKHVHISMGALNEPKGIYPMCLSIAPHPGVKEDNLYVLNTFPGNANGGCFEVLEPVRSRNEWSRDLMMPTWRWRLLPPPPFVSQHSSSAITGFSTVVDGNGCSTIYVSCYGGIGTYSFEAACHDPSGRLGWSPSEEWSYVGPWKLPFHGRAQYVPEFSLWLGFLDFSPYHLCAVDLYEIDGERPPPALQVWQDLNLPDGQVWLPVYLKLVNLGGGKFLIAKIFEGEATSERFALLTGVEMMVGAGDDQSIKMVKHKSARFAFGNDSIEWVL